MTIEELQAENEALKRQVFEATHINGLLDAEIQDLREKLRVSTERNAAQAAYIEELQHRDSVIENQKKRQFAYVQRNGTERGSFDMLLVSGWKAVQLRREGWKATVYVGSAVHDLEPVPSQAFWTTYDNYLQGKLL